jgi:hypothetical protein
MKSSEFRLAGGIARGEQIVKAAIKMGKMRAPYGMAGVLLVIALVLNLGLTWLGTNRVVVRCDHSIIATHDVSSVLLLSNSGTAAPCSSQQPHQIRLNLVETGFYPRDGISDSQATIFGLVVPYILAATAVYLLLRNLSGRQRGVTAFVLSGIALLSLILLGRQFRSAVEAHASLIDMFWGTQGARLDWVLLSTAFFSVAMGIRLFRPQPISAGAI